jgi:predicted transcriptional regulator
MTIQELRQARKAMGMTQQHLADRLGFTSTSVARMEGGRQKIMLVTELAVRYLLEMHKKTRKGNRKKWT